MPSQVHDVIHGTFNTAAPRAPPRPVTSDHAAVAVDPRANNVPSANTSDTSTAMGSITGAKATATAKTSAVATVRLIRSLGARSTTPSARSLWALSGSAVSTPDARRTRCNTQGVAAYTTSTVRRPLDIAPLTSGLRAYTNSAAIRARVEGKTAARRHTPATPTINNPRTNTVCSIPMWNKVTTLSPDNVAQPVGFGDVAPAPLGFQPDRNVESSWRGLSGNARNSPTGGRPPSKNDRPPTTRPTMTAIHATTGAVAL